MKNWFKRNVMDILYLWTALVCAVVYMVGGDVSYLIAALIAPITQHFYELNKDKR